MGDAPDSRDQKRPRVSPKKIIIDTDPGIDDAMAILFAFQSPELEVIGLTTTFGNVKTPMATQNALRLVELAGRQDVPVAEGDLAPLNGTKKERIADFVHGADGLGNTYPPEPEGAAVATSGPQFLVDKAREQPGEVTVVALGPLTNVAKAIELDPEFVRNIKQIIILGGAFFVNGNVNPAAEANIFGDCEAADVVLTSGADILVVGLNITHQCILTEQDLTDLRDSGGRYGRYVHSISQFYLKYHQETYGMHGVYLHDPTTMVAAVDSSLFTFRSGAVRVQCDGVLKGCTLMNDLADKKWVFPTEWCGKPPVKVAFGVQSDAVVALVKKRLSAP